SQLTEIGVQGKANTSTVTIRANGSLVHNEYRPADNLLLVDFPGVSVGKLDAVTHNVSVPGVASYQVHSYKSANGSNISNVAVPVAAAPIATVAKKNTSSAPELKPASLPLVSSTARPLMVRGVS